MVKEFISLLFLVFFCAILNTKLSAQIFSLGTKYQEKFMFQATFNYPFVYSKYKMPHEFMLGVDYTTKNKHAPSGIMPQATYGVRIVDKDRVDYFLMAGTSVGYNFQLYSNYKNQVKVSPFVYLEYGAVLNLKVGYDYSTQLGKGDPFVSIGIGGLHMFRNFTIM